MKKPLLCCWLPAEPRRPSGMFRQAELQNVLRLIGRALTAVWMSAVMISAAQAGTDVEQSDTKDHAESVLEIAASRARAFSDRVGLQQADVNRTFTRLRANELLLADKSRDRQVRSRFGGFGFGLRAQAEDAGDIAGLSYLHAEVASLKEQFDQAQERFIAVLQEEAWKQLTDREREQIRKHKLVPDTLENKDLSQWPARQVREDREEDFTDAWHEQALDGTDVRLSFPNVPEKTVESDRVVYQSSRGSTKFRCTRYTISGIDPGVPDKQVLTAQAEGTVDRDREQGNPSARIAVHQNGQLFHDIYQFFRTGHAQRMNVVRLAIVNSEVTAIEVINADANDTAEVERFFRSFQEHAGAQVSRTADPKRKAD
ncbi:MAG: hypothetical protein KDB01_01805 [Planctomycetaceae bacterium]|nr:hypothetical protein [Planctomycetaceae bacterium]